MDSKVPHAKDPVYGNDFSQRGHMERLLDFGALNE